MPDQHRPSPASRPRAAPAPRASLAGVVGIVAASLALVGATLLGLHALIPQDWKVQRSILINAPIPVIHAIVNDLSQWSQWAQWNHHNLSPSNRLSPRTVGEGAELHWKATATKGRRAKRSQSTEGRIAIVRSEPGVGVWLESSVAQAPQSASALTYESRLGSTEVTWTDSGHLDQLLGGLSIDIFQQDLGTHMEKGLLLLKHQAETKVAEER